MDTHDTPPQQVWVHENEDMLVTVIVEETLNKRNLESIKTIPTEVKRLDTKVTGYIVKRSTNGEYSTGFGLPA